MRRREFITLLGSTAAMWPRLARAQGQARVPKVGVLWHAANIEEETPYYQSLVEGFRKLGYVDGQNITEPRRVCWRLQPLRGWSDEQADDEQVFP